MNRQQAEQLRLDDKHWTLGVIYVCREDPRAVVRNRWRFGWTWNFGNPWVLVLLPAAVMIFLFPILVLAPAVNPSSGELIAMYVVILLLLMGVAHYVAHGPR